MSGKVDKKPMSVSTRRWIVRGGLAVVYLALAISVFISGRAHTILLDNKTADDGSYQAFRSVKIFLDGQEPLELAARERDKLTVQGQRHRIRIETGSAATVLEASFTVPLDVDVILVSVPKMAAGIEPFWQPFVNDYQRPAAEEEVLPSLDAPPPLE